VCASSCLMSLTPLRVRAAGVFEGVSVSVSLSVRVCAVCTPSRHVCACVHTLNSHSYAKTNIQNTLKQI